MAKDMFEDYGIMENLIKGMATQMPVNKAEMLYQLELDKQIKIYKVLLLLGIATTSLVLAFCVI